MLEYDKILHVTPLSIRQRTYAALVAGGTVSRAEAARQAGYSPRSARTSALRNDKNPGVIALIEDYSNEYAAEAEVTRAEIIMALKKEAMHSDSASSRVRALELLGKTLCMFTDRTEIEQRPSFADELERLQPAIQIAKEEMKKRRSLSGAELQRDTDEAVEIAMRSVRD